MRIIQAIVAMLCAGLFTAGAALAGTAATPMGPSVASKIDRVIEVDFACKLTKHGLICGSTKGQGSQKKKNGDDQGDTDQQGGGGEVQKGGQPAVVAAKSIACPGAVVGTTVCATCPTGSLAVAMTCNFCPPGKTFSGDVFHCSAPLN